MPTLHRYMKLQYVFILALALSACKHKKNNPYDPDNYLTQQEQQDILWKTIRYSTKLPPGAKQETKFDTAFDWYYKRGVAEYDIRAWYKTENGDQYFLMTREARSITPMRESIGGKLRLDDRDSLVEYDEIFRTWKMPDSVLNTKYPMLFEKMVKGESLEPYYPQNAGDQYIEFPDGRYYFDKTMRRWRNPEMDTLLHQ
jgi:hypothetical protein